MIEKLHSINDQKNSKLLLKEFLWNQNNSYLNSYLPNNEKSSKT